MAITPVAVIEFAIGLIVVMVVLFIIYYVIDFMAPGNLAVPIKYVIGAIALIAILIVAEKALFGSYRVQRWFGQPLRQLRRV